MTIPLPFDDETIERVAHGVLDTSWPYAEWSHAAHFAAALWLLRHPAVLTGHGGIEAVIRRYNRAVGVPESPTRGFHATITEASMRVAARELARHGKDAPLSRVLAGIMDSPLGRSGWLLVHWSEARLMSPEARAGWIEPDLVPLPEVHPAGL
ncbi:hypothetical protein EDF56_103253 [Novosphingobium sp. PhB165]|uniref:hypothetical protein n=1 Tax=Novosphingobium sp. PhB165 TaxID=2485105 RepID=UPI00105342BE|nr:hypothetical protein [Novosphingobium sp. PhB165]TCM19610.1 hypothetical protein EDF56_103253 [Novosphingobium sp. PhB165]